MLFACSPLPGGDRKGAAVRTGAAIRTGVCAWRRVSAKSGARQAQPADGTAGEGRASLFMRFADLLYFHLMRSL